MPLNFIKFHGFGNDYIVIDAEQFRDPNNWGSFARRICNRHYGAGADGIAVVSPSPDEDADFRVRIFNPDGSEAALSGNGTRCAAAYLYHQNLWQAEELRLTTRAGVKRYVLLEDDGHGKYVFDSELGQPKFDSVSIPMLTEPALDQVVDYELDVDGETFKVTALQMGNPNCCLFVNDFNDLDWRKLGKAIENHKQFPDRTNVVFVRIKDRQNIELRIWERGVGETTASGTCSCAAAVAAMVKEETERAIEVEMPGGNAKIQWRDDGEVVITGSAEVIYAGQWLALVP
ncbi:MAG: diaminopimelate epimerase [Alphaproteobacteria bacterium]|nr:diaminopimelate epimerase [Alphaproteobacteria bacterium]